MHPGPAGVTPSTGRAAPAGGPADVRRRAADAGVGEFGVAVVADLSARRAARPAAHADPRATAAVGRGPAAHAGEDPGTGALARVGKVIQRQFGIRYHPSHVWRRLTARGWQC